MPPNTQENGRKIVNILLSISSSIASCTISGRKTLNVSTTKSNTEQIVALFRFPTSVVFDVLKMSRDM